MHIRFWNEKDQDWLLYAIKKFLEDGLDKNGDLLPTDRNARIYYATGISAVGRGDPCLVCVVDGVFAGFVYWIGVGNFMDQRWNTIQALGSYTVPEFRSRGVADKLRKEARRIAIEKGYNRIFGPVHFDNKKGLEVFEKEYGAKINSVNFEFIIEGN